jgi:hypothetical protein
MNPLVAVICDIVSWSAMIVLVWCGPQWIVKLALTLLIVFHMIILLFCIRAMGFQFKKPNNWDNQ